MTFDLVIKQGTLVDPVNEIHAVRDIGIHQGKIAAVMPEIPSSQASEQIDARGKLVTPGLIDLHTHVAEHFMPIAVAADEAGVNSGVTAVSDAGSVGYVAYKAFKHYVARVAKTDVFCFLHLSPTGQMISPEICWESLDTDRLLDLVSRESDTIKGIKIRANSQMVANPDLAILKKAKRVCSRANLPLMIHIGMSFDESVPAEILTTFTRRMLSHLEPGDILTHTYTSRPGGVIFQDRGVIPELKAAMTRGVVIDVAPAKSHFSFPLARIGLGEGVVPTVLSTDITNTNFRGPALFSLPVVMSKFLALGLGLDEIISKVTVAPAKILKETHRRGSLTVGYPADITILELLEGEFVFSDGIAGNTLVGKQLLEPRTTIKNGTILPAQSRFRDPLPGESVTLTKGA